MIPHVYCIFNSKIIIYCNSAYCIIREVFIWTLR
nr:MAG TPA: hypothetical protein [Caudoviricetes sp.]